MFVVFRLKVLEKVNRSSMMMVVLTTWCEVHQFTLPRSENRQHQQYVAERCEIYAISG